MVSYYYYLTCNNCGNEFEFCYSSEERDIYVCAKCNHMEAYNVLPKLDFDKEGNLKCKNCGAVTNFLKCIKCGGQIRHKACQNCGEVCILRRPLISDVTCPKCKKKGDFKEREVWKTHCG
jgi:RecJ-like exonuclease